MREIQYKRFSLRTHKKNWLLEKPNTAQFEITFRCGLHCKHCYTDCYNKPAYLKKELKTDEVKFILDKIHRAGVIWLCFTGGDPLTRKDFLDIYSSAKKRGFIITVFTNGYSMSEEIVRYFKKSPPFAIEITLNAVTENLYERISQKRGAFNKVIKEINLVLKQRLPLKVKTEITRDNLGEVSKIKKFIKGLGLKFRPHFDLHAGLNGNLSPCDLRVPPQDILGLNGLLKTRRLNRDAESSLFPCAIESGDGFYIDPYGNTFPCRLIRSPSFNLLEVDVEYALDRLLPLVRGRKFITDSKCRNCSVRDFCRSCPGRALLEKGDMESPIEYYCELARAIEGSNE